MKKNTVSRVSRVHLVSIFLLLILVVLISVTGYLYKENYFSCLSIDMKLCLQSEKYQSRNGEFSFRYLKGYPIIGMTAEELQNKYHSDFETIEWVNFTKSFYPNAGGDRLGYIQVQKNDNYKNTQDYVDKQLKILSIPPQIESRKIGNQDAVCANVKHQPHSFDPASFRCVLVYKDHFYVILFTHDDYYHKQPAEYYDTASKMILSTLKFY